MNSLEYLISVMPEDWGKYEKTIQDAVIWSHTHRELKNVFAIDLI